jgi:hypothetical protein
MHSEKLDKEEARQASTTPYMRYVLAISIALAVIAMFVSLGIFMG